MNVLEAIEAHNAPILYLNSADRPKDAETNIRVADLALLASAVRAAVRWSIAQRNWHTLAEDDPDDRYWAACEVFYQTEDELDAALAPLLEEVE